MSRGRVWNEWTIKALVHMRALNSCSLYVCLYDSVPGCTLYVSDLVMVLSRHLSILVASEYPKPGIGVSVQLSYMLKRDFYQFLS